MKQMAEEKEEEQEETKWKDVENTEAVGAFRPFFQFHFLLSIFGHGIHDRLTSPLSWYRPHFLRL